MIHISIYNRFEKELVQLIFKYSSSPFLTHRPNKKCNSYISTSIDCQGMPSGHAESITLAFILLSLFKISPIYLSLVIIFIICLQRILWKRHTIYQVIIGILLGCFYAILYFYVWKIDLSLVILLCFILFLTIIIINVLIISYYQENQTFPEWVPKNIYSSIDKKQKNNSLMNKFLTYGLTIIYDRKTYGYLSWKDIESILNNLCLRIKYKPDIIIGIKTGGEILAGYVSKHLNTSLDFMETQKLFIIKDINNKSDKMKSFAIKLPLSEFYRGKNVLLIDESYSDRDITIEIAKDYLFKNGAVNVEIMVLSIIDKVISNNEKNYITTNKRVAAFPWSF